MIKDPRTTILIILAILGMAVMSWGVAELKTAENTVRQDVTAEQYVLSQLEK